MFPREQLEEMVKYLAETYPKTFFLQPHLKRPLKKNILVDLDHEQVLTDDAHREAAYTFYTADWGYLATVQAGTKRVDLRGLEVGTVSMQEQIDAEKKVKAQKEELKERRKAERVLGPIEVARRLHADGKIPTNSLSKIPAPPIVSTPMTKTTKTPAAPAAEKPPQPDAVTKLRTLWGSIDTVLSTEDPTLQAALIAPALKVLIAEASKLVAAIESKTQ